VEIWTKIIFQVPQMCTELNGFAQRSLYFLHFWNETKKREIKEGFFGGSKTWVLFSSKIFVLLQEEGVLRPSIIRL